MFIQSFSGIHIFDTGTTQTAEDLFQAELEQE